MHPKILVSAGEASGDLYASLVVDELRRIRPGAEFFGCTGPACAQPASAPWWMPPAWPSLAWSKWSPTSPHLRRISQIAGRRIHREARSRHPHRLPRFPPARSPQTPPAGRSRVYLVAPRPGMAPGSRPPDARNLLRLLCIFPLKRNSSPVMGRRNLHRPPLAGLVRPSLTGTSFSETQVVPGASLNYGVAWEPPRRGRAPFAGAARCGGADLREQAVNVVLPASVTTGTAFFTGDWVARRFR